MYVHWKREGAHTKIESFDKILIVYLVFYSQWADLFKCVEGVKSSHLVLLKVAKVTIRRHKYAQSVAPLFFPGKHDSKVNYDIVICMYDILLNLNEMMHKNSS